MPSPSFDIPQDPETLAAVRKLCDDRGYPASGGQTPCRRTRRCLGRWNTDPYNARIRLAPCLDANLDVLYTKMGEAKAELEDLELAVEAIPAAGGGGGRGRQPGRLGGGRPVRGRGRGGLNRPRERRRASPSPVRGGWPREAGSGGGVSANIGQVSADTPTPVLRFAPARPSPQGGGKARGAVYSRRRPDYLTSTPRPLIKTQCAPRSNRSWTPPS